jgi:hypothetical protein
MAAPLRVRDRTQRSRKRAVYLDGGVALLVLSVAFACAPVSARANLIVPVCSDLATGAASNSGGWSTSTSGEYVGASPCNGGGYMDAVLYANVSHNYTDNATLTFAAPANMTITSFSLWRWDQAAAYQTDGAPVNTISYDGQAVDACSQAFGCQREGSQASATNSVVGASGLSAHELQVVAACGGGPGGVCPSSPENDEIRIYGGLIELAQSTSPTVSAVGGSLPASGTHSGTQTISFSAGDSGSGVYEASLVIDGQTAITQVPNSNGGRCQPTRRASNGPLVFNYVTPCPGNVSGSLSYNTAHLANGNHDMQLVITDAAGNTTTAYDGEINVQNGSAALTAPALTTGSTGAGGSPQGHAARWRVSLHVTPRHVRQHTVITLSGVVATSPRPAAGKLIYLQARSVALVWRGKGSKRHRVTVGGSWITWKVLNANSSGRFTATYRFKLAGDHRYQLRAVAPKEAGYPNPTGGSPPVLVVET